MLSINHLEDYLCERVGDSFEIGFNTEGHRRLNHKAKLPLNLNQGYNSKYNNSDEEHRSIDVLLKWLMKKSPEGIFERVMNGAQFVSRRGVLSRMAAGDQLKNKGEWSTVCEKKNGVVFIEEMCAGEKRRSNENMSDAEKRATHMGRQFEKCLLLPVTESNGDEQALPAEKSDVRMVIEARIEKSQKTYKMLYSGEVDAIDQDGKYVEMKTQKNAMEGYWFWKEKSLKWWLQSKLVGVDYLLVGLKDKEGYCRQIKKVKLNYFESHSQWDGGKCLEFLHEVLDFIYGNVPEGGVKIIQFKDDRLWCHDHSKGILSQEFVDHFHMK